MASGRDYTLDCEEPLYGTVGSVVDDTQVGVGMLAPAIPLGDLDHPEVFVANTLAGLGLGEPMMVIQPVGEEILPGIALPTLSALPLPDLGLTQPALPSLSLPILPEVTLPQLAMPPVVAPDLSGPSDLLGGIVGPGGIAGPPEPGDPLMLVTDTLAGLGAEDLLQTVSETTSGLGLF